MRKNKVIIPRSNFIFEKDDLVVFLAKREQLKAVENISSSHVKQTMNYLAASKMKLGLIINFGEDQLTYKRVLL